MWKIRIGKYVFNMLHINMPLSKWYNDEMKILEMN